MALFAARRLRSGSLRPQLLLDPSAFLEDLVREIKGVSADLPTYGYSALRPLGEVRAVTPMNQELACGTVRQLDPSPVEPGDE